MIRCETPGLHILGTYWVIPSQGERQVGCVYWANGVTHDLCLRVRDGALVYDDLMRDCQDVDIQVLDALARALEV